MSKPAQTPVKDLTVGEVAELTHQSRSIVLTLVREGRFPNAYKAGRGTKSSPIRIPYADVEHYRSTQPLAHTA